MQDSSSQLTLHGSGRTETAGAEFEFICRRCILPLYSFIFDRYYCLKSDRKINLIMVEKWVYERPDFSASLQAIPQPETGLRSSLRQGIKLDLMYEGDKSVAWFTML